MNIVRSEEESACISHAARETRPSWGLVRLPKNLFAEADDA